MWRLSMVVISISGVRLFSFHLPKIIIRVRSNTAHTRFDGLEEIEAILNSWRATGTSVEHFNFFLNAESA